jgi:hypothetical protein
VRQEPDQAALLLLSQTLLSRRFESGSIAVNNEESAQYTVVTIEEGRERTAALLDVASAMTGVGCVIHEAIIQARCVYPHVFTLEGFPRCFAAAACASSSLGLRTVPCFLCMR